jgi:hypothetical protein
MISTISVFLIRNSTYWTCVNRLKDSYLARVITVTRSKEMVQEADDHSQQLPVGEEGL